MPFGMKVLHNTREAQRILNIRFMKAEFLFLSKDVDDVRGTVTVYATFRLPMRGDGNTAATMVVGIQEDTK